MHIDYYTKVFSIIAPQIIASLNIFSVIDCFFLFLSIKTAYLPPCFRDFGTGEDADTMAAIL